MAGYIADRVAAIIAEHGETMVLARATEATTVTLKGKRLPGATDAVGGSAEQQRFRVQIAPIELAASAWASKVPSAAGDTLTVADRPRTIVDVFTLSDGDDVALYELEVAG